MLQAVAYPAGPRRRPLTVNFQSPFACIEVSGQVLLSANTGSVCVFYLNFVFWICLLYVFQVIPFYVSNATNYFGRIIDKYLDLFATLNAEMNEYFKDSSNKTAVEKVEKCGLYGLAEKTLFHR